MALKSICLLFLELSLSSSFLHDSRQLKFFTLDAPFDGFELSLLNAATVGASPKYSINKSKKIHPEEKLQSNHTALTSDHHSTNSSPKISHAVGKVFPSTTTLTTVVTASSEYASGFDEVSYVEIQAPTDVNAYLELTLMVKLRLPTGLIYLLPSERHYFSIYSQNAFLTVHYALGDRYAILSSPHPLSLDTWHHVEVWRSGRAALLKIDEQPWIENRVNKTIVEDEIETNVFAYFGGAPDPEISSSIPVHSGLSGCLKKIYQNGRPVDLVRDAVATRKVHQCGWDVCTGVYCQEQAQCIAYRATPYCRCKFPTFGPNCEKSYISPLSEFQFTRFSYLKLSDRHIMKHVTGESLDLSMMILVRNRTDDSNLHSPDQILAYTGDIDSVGDYLHLVLTGDNELKLAVNLGSGPVVLTHPVTVAPDGLWHNITVTRNGRHITLTVDELSISSMSPGPSIELNVYESFYIGGLQKINPALLGFTGCIRDIRIGFEFIESPTNATEAVNITECF